MKKTLILLSAILSLASLTGCDTNNTNSQPIETTTLNMHNEDNGKTFLGTTDVYINNANNFTSSSFVFTSLGRQGSISIPTTPKLSNLVTEIAVEAQTGYQIFDKSCIRKFPSGQIAVFEGAVFCYVYVNNLITNDEDKTIGAQVEFASMYPNSETLPPYGEYIHTFTGETEEFEYQLSPNFEYVIDSSWASHRDFQIELTDKTLKIKLLVSPNEHNNFGPYPIYIRDGIVYTIIYIDVK